MTRLTALCLLLVILVLWGTAGCGSTGAPEAPTQAEEPTAMAEPTSQPEEPASVPSTATSPPSTPTPAPPAEEAPEPTSTPAPPFEISSGAFEPGEEIPVEYSCDGANLSPPLEWSGVPAGTQSLALVVDDPDSEPPGFVHWVIYGIPPTSSGLPEGVPAEATLPDGALQGTNDFAQYPAGTFPGGAAINQVGYDGPCPPSAHRYAFTLYALDTVLDLQALATGADLLQAMEGHVLGEVELTGAYTPQR